jgi:hypothetical protein
MKRFAHGFHGALKGVGAGLEEILGPSIESLRETDWFCIRFFVSLQVVFFYGLMVLFFAIDTLPGNPGLYVLGCGSGGVIAALLLKWSWTVGKAHRP